MKGVESRIGKKREDLPWREEEFDEEFKEYIINWDEETAPKLRNLIAKYKDKKNIIVFSSRKESEDYLLSLKNKIANKRIKSTIVIGIFLLISILFVIWLIPFNLKERYSAYVESVQNSPKVSYFFMELPSLEHLLCYVEHMYQHYLVLLIQQFPLYFL